MGRCPIARLATKALTMATGCAIIPIPSNPGWGIETGYHKMTIALSDHDHMHVRHARQALNMLVNGAVRYLESDYGPHDTADRKAVIATLIAELHGELDDWSDTE